MNKKREGLFSSSKREKKQDRILEDLGSYREKSRDELSNIITKVKQLIRESKKLKNKITTLEDTIFQLENENLLLRGDIQTVLAKNVNLERFEPENFDLRVLVASLEKENFTLKTKLFGKSGKVLPSSQDRAEPELRITKRMVEEVLPPSQVMMEPETPDIRRLVEEMVPPDQAMREPDPPDIRRLVEEVLPPDQAIREPEPPGIRRLVEEVLPPGQDMKEPEPPDRQRVIEEEQLSPSHVPEVFEPSVIEDIIEELLPPSRVSEELNPPLEQNEIGEELSLNQIPEVFEPSIIEDIIEELLPPSRVSEELNPPLEQNEIGEERSLNQVPEEIELPLESKEKIIYDERKGLMNKQEEISSLKIQRKRKCPKCGNEKRSYIRELEDKTNIIMQSPRFYGKKFKCNICATEWK